MAVALFWKDITLCIAPHRASGSNVIAQGCQNRPSARSVCLVWFSPNTFSFHCTHGPSDSNATLCVSDLSALKNPKIINMQTSLETQGFPPMCWESGPRCRTSAPTAKQLQKLSALLLTHAWLFTPHRWAEAEVSGIVQGTWAPQSSVFLKKLSSLKKKKC